MEMDLATESVEPDGGPVGSCRWWGGAGQKSSGRVFTSGVPLPMSAFRRQSAAFCFRLWAWQGLNSFLYGMCLRWKCQIWPRSPKKWSTINIGDLLTLFGAYSI